MARSDFATAKSKYDDAINIYLTNGKADYVINLGEKWRGFPKQQQTAYNGALLTENRADMLSASIRTHQERLIMKQEECISCLEIR